MFTLPLNTSNYDNELALTEACLKRSHFIIIVDHVRISITVIPYGPWTYGQVRGVRHPPFGLLIVSHCLYVLRVFLLSAPKKFRFHTAVTSFLFTMPLKSLGVGWHGWRFLLASGDCCPNERDAGQELPLTSLFALKVLALYAAPVSALTWRLI